LLISSILLGVLSVVGLSSNDENVKSFLTPIQLILIVVVVILLIIDYRRM